MGELQRLFLACHGATIVQMAKDRGMMFGTGEERELDWDDEISYEHHDEHVVVNKNWIEGKEINAPTDWQPHREINQISLKH